MRNGGNSTFKVVAAESAGENALTTQHAQLESKTDGNYGFSFFDGGLLETDSEFGAVTLFKFDFRFDTDTSQLRIRARNSADVATKTSVDYVRTDLKTNDAKITVGTLQTLEYIVNNSMTDETITTDNGDVTIESGSYALYVDGAVYASGSNYSVADGKSVDYLTLWAVGDNDVAAPLVAKIQLDNFEVKSIPEPATLGLLSLFGMGLLFCRRTLMR